MKHSKYTGTRSNIASNVKTFKSLKRHGEKKLGGIAFAVFMLLVNRLDSNAKILGFNKRKRKIIYELEGKIYEDRLSV